MSIANRCRLAPCPAGPLLGLPPAPTAGDSGAGGGRRAAC
jgi:hypothetical protein